MIPRVHQAILSGLFLLFVPSAVLGASSGSEPTNRVKVIRVPNAGKVVKACVGPDETIHLLFDTDHGPEYLKSTNGGVSFSAPMRIVDAGAQKPGLKFHGEDLAIGKDGRVHVALANNAWKLKLPEEEWGFYFSSLLPDAEAFMAVRNINRKPSEGFSLAADERGNVSACFLSGKLFTMVSHDNGESFSRFEEPDPNWDPCDCCTTAAAYGVDGKLALLYREESNNERDMFVALSGENGDRKPVRKRVSGTPWKVNACPMTYFSITRTDTGFVAAWPTKGQVYFSKLDKDGGVLPPGEIRTPGTSGMRKGLVALGASDGTTLIGWKNSDVLGWQVYDAKGRPEGSPGSAPSPGGGAAAVVLRDGNFIVFP